MGKEPKDIKAIFSEALEKQTAEERKAYLDEACENDAELRSKVEALLKAHEQVGDFLEIPALGPDVTLEEFPSIEGPGTKIGRYELLELIGEGGMGLVYLAQQTEPVKRRVALKIVKLGMDTKQVIARFEAERQTLALLEHPNIAHVFDAGTTDSGRPYFVMEYVEGKSITKYCDEYKLSVEERLKLLRLVCDGVHHAQRLLATNLDVVEGHVRSDLGRLDQAVVGDHVHASIRGLVGCGGSRIAIFGNDDDGRYALRHHVVDLVVLQLDVVGGLLREHLVPFVLQKPSHEHLFVLPALRRKVREGQADLDFLPRDWLIRLRGVGRCLIAATANQTGREQRQYQDGRN